MLPLVTKVFPLNKNKQFMSFFISLIFFLIITFLFVVIVTCFVAVVTALFALIVSKDEDRASNSINAVLSAGVFGVIFGVGVLITHFLACGTKTDFGFGDYHFVKMESCAIEVVDGSEYYCTDSCGRVVIDSIVEAYQVDTVFIAKKESGKICLLNLKNGLPFNDTTRYVEPDFVRAERFYVKKHEEVTGTIRSVGFTLTVLLALFAAYLNFCKLRQKKDGVVSRFRYTPIISKLFD